MLPEGLRLRTATPADAEVLAASNAMVHEGEQYREWTRDLLTSGHPTVEPDDVFLVTHPRDESLWRYELSGRRDGSGRVRGGGLDRRGARQRLHHGLRLVVERGRLAAAERISETAGAGAALPPDQLLLQLVLGYRDLDALVAERYDCPVDDERTGAVLAACFPRRPSDVWPLG